MIEMHIRNMNSTGPRIMGELFSFHGCLFLFERICILGTNGELQYSSCLSEQFPMSFPCRSKSEVGQSKTCSVIVSGEHAARDDRESYAYHFAMLYFLLHLWLLTIIPENSSDYLLLNHFIVL
jgi:hypothetical protein